MNEDEQTPYSFTYNIEVKSDIFNAYIYNDSGQSSGAPGDTVDLRAGVYHYGETPEEELEYTYAWSIAEGGEGYASLDSESGDSVTVTFGDLPGGTSGQYSFCVELKVFDKSGDEIANATYWMSLTDESYELQWVGFDPDMDVGDVDTVTVNAVYKKVGQEDVIVDGETQIYVNDGSLLIEPVEGETNQFTVTRLTLDLKSFL